MTASNRMVSAVDGAHTTSFVYGPMARA